MDEVKKTESKTKEPSREHARLVHAKLVELAYKIKESKSPPPPHLEPTQELDHLGFRLDTKNMTLTVPKTKLRNIRREGSEAQSSRNGPQYKRALIPSSAKPMTTPAAVSPACLITQHLTAVNNAALKAGASLPYRPRSKTNSTASTSSLSPQASDLVADTHNPRKNYCKSHNKSRPTNDPPSEPPKAHYQPFTKQTMQIKTVAIVALLASVVYAKGNYVCKGFSIEEDCKGKYICVNAYGNCAVNSDHDVECDCYIKVHHGPFLRSVVNRWWQ
ncbi:hypothetical protein K457DRAFT_37002 [Linnemannia elongata AG-77]|uniref:Uncharacterized protein n=1 Tax=Linnemannia elongata AG-77 TaxID=1314771 RepID=A0A197JCH4_9FUNG|nr:hypothetical protein K457DRAFT_37002 [Linnemannia elongata AG-77]